MDIKGEMDTKTVIVGDFNTHWHQWTDCADRKSQGISSRKGHTRSDGFNGYLQSILPQWTKYILFSMTCGKFSWTDHMSG